MRSGRAVLRFWLSFLGAILLGILLNIFWAHKTKTTVLSECKGLSFYLPQDNTIDLSLYYSYTHEFSNDRVVYPKGNSEHEYRFTLPGSDSVPTHFRLDFGNDNHAFLTTIDSMAINFTHGRMVLSQNALFGHIILNSASISLDKNARKLGLKPNALPFDPYIVFDPLAKIILDHGAVKWLLLLSPFVLFLLLNFGHLRTNAKIGLIDLLLLLFIICIPLKIAWTTFITLVLCAIGIYTVIRKGRFDFTNPAGVLLIAFFLVLLVFGRPASLKDIDHQLAFILFYVILGSLRVQWQKAARFYVYFMLLLNALLVTAGISFLWSFKSVFGLELLQYFIQIKTYSGNIREWLYYDHAVFLTFFGLLGLLFLQELYPKVRKHLHVHLVYNILLLVTIILFGARISLLIYLVYFINLMVKLRPKHRLLLNTAVFLTIAALLFLYVGSIDQERFGLWSVSWEAIKEKPWFGHGLGTSDRVLHNATFMQRANATIPMTLNHSHNQFLTFLLELGCIGTGLVLAMLVFYLKRTAQYKSITMVLFIFGSGYVFLTESILQTSKPLFVLCFLFALITMKPAKAASNELDDQR